MSQAFETLIQIYADGEGFFPKPDGKEMGTARKLLTNFRRGFNTRQPLSVFEDTSVSGPSGAGGKSSLLSSYLKPPSTADYSIK